MIKRVLIGLGIMGCAWTGGCATPDASTADLNAALWRQTAAEYDATTRQAYELARVMLEKGLADPNWNPLTDDEAATGDATLKPAVILDVDETVLDNSKFQAWLIREGKAYSSERWNRWCNDASAGAIEGALEFLNYAKSKGVTIFYVTNRNVDVEPATVINLRDKEFPLDPGLDTVLTKYERPGWRSEKSTRRRHIAELGYRVILLLGDNLGDFQDIGGMSVAERAEIFDAHRDRWGTSWITIPNPSYGSWEQTLYDFQYDLSPREKQDRKLQALDAWQPSP